MKRVGLVVGVVPGGRGVVAMALLVLDARTGLALVTC